ncbi:MBL fold metallo-hydrolase [Candidatus Beckwithbacteria bacterium]|nr:MBL fold metallo-hydrolase [Candidatus Beckwithbacteria bacterium]
MEIITIPVGRLQVNCYLLIAENKETLIIDPGDDADLIAQKISEEQLKPLAMLATHGHFDHVMAAFELQENFNIPFLLDPKDEFLLERLSQTASHFLGEKVEAWPPRKITPLSIETIRELSLPKEFDFKIIPTPGHTPGSASLYFPCHPESSMKSKAKDLAEKKILRSAQNDIASCVFVGDVLFAGGGFGRTDFSYCSSADLQKSIARLFALPDETIIYSGHGEGSRIESEKEYFD